MRQIDRKRARLIEFSRLGKIGPGYDADAFASDPITFFRLGTPRSFAPIPAK